jgi:hypothetical protein
MYNTYGKEYTEEEEEEEEVKGTYILLPVTFAVVVTSVVRGPQDRLL